MITLNQLSALVVDASHSDVTVVSVEVARLVVVLSIKEVVSVVHKVLSLFQFFIFF
jgi:hypothetical protein